MIRQLFNKQLNQFFNRRGAETLPVIFGWRRIYVLPSKTGLFFSLIWFLMLMAGLNFNNNMSLMLVFLLFGLAQVTLYKTFFNVVNLRLEKVSAEPVHLGETIELKLELGADSDKFQIVGSIDQTTDKQNINEQQNPFTLQLASQHRGMQNIDRIKFFSRYPLGLFTVWVYCIPKAQVLIYPKPEKPVLEFPNHGGLDGEKTTRQKGDELTSIREYQQGDPVRDIAWKKTAQSHKTWVKEFNQTQGKHLLFDFTQIGGQHVESKLSRITAWVLAAEKAQLCYQVKLPGYSSDMATGQAHKHSCLKALALFQNGEQS